MITYRKVLSFSWLRFCNCSMYKNLMQINWHWNKQRLHNPCQALFPYTNLHHGAALLKAAYSVKHSWPAAVGHYHSPGQKQAQRNRAEAHIQRYQRHYASLSAF